MVTVRKHQTGLGLVILLLSMAAHAATYAVSVSTQANHSNAVVLNGATLSGNAYIFTSLVTQPTNFNPTGIAKVCFWLDNTAMSGTAIHCESITPFDYAGSVNNTASSSGLPLSTVSLANGPHTITQSVTKSAGGTETDIATFTVQNGTVVPPTTTVPVITTSTLPSATSTAAYSATLTASGGTPPYTWTLQSGTLPSGLSLSSSGVISGTPANSPTFTIKVTDSKGLTASANESLGLTTSATVIKPPPPPPPPPPSGAGVTFFSITSFINTLLPANSSVDPNSTTMVANSIGAQSSVAHLSNGGYGVALVYSKSTDKVYTISCTLYSSNTCTVPNDPWGTAPHTVQFPIPKGVILPSGSDRNTAFVYQALDGSPYAGMEMDCWVPSYNASTDTWSCYTVSVVKNIATGWGTCANGNIRNFHCNGGYAAGFALTAGPIRPEEIAAGNIPHALVAAISNPGTGIICPATHTDKSGSGIPEGGHFFLPKSYNVDAQSWPSWVKIVAHALQNYGGYIIDYGGSFEIKGFTDQNAVLDGTKTWASVGVPLDVGSNLNMIPWNQMQVVTMVPCN